MAHFEQATGATDEWYTPPYVFAAPATIFDLDVAMPKAPLYWIPTLDFITEDSLSKTWKGFVWCNSPFGGRNGIVPWLDKFFAHGDGIALTPDRTSAPWWQDAARKCDVALFVSPKIRFLRPDGSAGVAPGTGTTLLAVGRKGVSALHNASRNGLGFLMSIAF